MKHLIRFAVGISFSVAVAISAVVAHAFGHSWNEATNIGVGVSVLIFLAYWLGGILLTGKTWRGIKF